MGSFFDSHVYPHYWRDMYFAMEHSDQMSLWSWRPLWRDSTHSLIQTT